MTGPFFPRLAFVLLLFAIHASAGAVHCANSGADASALQSAVTAGGVVSISGTCALGSAAINIGDSVTLTGPAQLNSTGSFIFVIWANNVSISGLTFNGAGLHLIAVPQQSNFVFQNNTIRNTNGNNGIVVDGILRVSSISANTFSSIAPDGFQTATYSSLGFGGCYSTGNCDTNGSGIIIYGGIDQTSITNNAFDLVANDGMHIGWNLIAADPTYFLTKNNDISYNTFSRVHRIGIEAQAIWSYPRCGVNGSYSCDMSHNFSTNTTVKGNYFHDPFLTYVETYAYSLAIWGDGAYINNAGIDNTASGQTPGYGIEDMGNNVLTQGNVIAADYVNGANPHGWAASIIYGAQASGSIFTTQNNVLCGDATTSRSFGNEPNSGGTKVDQYNYLANACPNAGALTQSVLRIASVSPAPSTTGGTWNVAVTSALPVKYVQFFLDGSATPIATQEVQDVSTTFAADRAWLYHATISAATLKQGTHTIAARATDVAGATQSISQTFNGGSVSGPSTLQVTPSSLSFGSETIGVPASKTVTLAAQTGSVSFAGLTTTGPNAKDFVTTSACGSTLAAGASCQLTITFTPSAAIAESATLAVTDNASGSPQSIPLTGAGVAVVTNPNPTTLKAGAYNIRDASGNTMDLGWGLHPEWGFGRNVYLYNYNNGPGQQVTYTSANTLQSIQDPSQYLYDAGGVLALGTKGDSFVIAAVGNGYTIQDVTAGGVYVQTPHAIDPPNTLSLSSSATVWSFTSIGATTPPPPPSPPLPPTPPSPTLPTAKAYTFGDASGNVMDLGWALHPDWGAGTNVYLFSNNSGVNQRITYTASDQLQSVANPGQYLYDAGGVLALGPNGDHFTIVSSGTGYTIHDDTASLYVNTNSQIAPPNKLGLSSVATIWTASPVQ